MAGLVDAVLGQLGGGGLSTIAGTLGLGQDDAQSAVGTAVTVLAGAMAHNSSKPEGAQALDSALGRDHDGSIFDDIGGFLGNFTAGPGAAILGHVLGSAQPQVQQTVSEKSGLSLDKVIPLLVMIAPLVMGILGKMKKDDDMDASAVATTLAAERREAEKKDDNNLLGSVLGILGGMAAPAPAPQPEPQPVATTDDGSGGGGILGGILGAVGGLFGRKKKGS
jgi:hypothetical protein